MVEFSRHTADEIGPAIEAEVAFFQELGQGFEWKVFTHDLPLDLKERLRAAGFEIGEPEAVMAISLTDSLSLHPDGSGDEITFRQIQSDRDLDEYFAVADSVWGSRTPGERAYYAALLAARPIRMRAYVARIDGKPVHAARMTLCHDSGVAGLRGGGTLPDFRRRGIYAASVRLRLSDAREAGMRYALVDAKPTSEPILKRLDFEQIATTYPCTKASRLPG